jgi:hypothetical protein
VLGGLLPSLTKGKACSCPSTATLEQVVHLLPSWVLAPRARFYTCEMRIIAYSQLVESCRSLAMESLNAAFSASADFVDAYVHPFSITALL